MQQFCQYGSVRGAAGNRRPYRDISYTRALVPRMSVDKLPGELNTFAALVEESQEFGHDWAVVFVAGLSGRAGRPPTSDDASQPLQRMIEAIKTGAFGAFMPFDRQGQPIRFG